MKDSYAIDWEEFLERVAKTEKTLFKLLDYLGLEVSYKLIGSDNPFDMKIEDVVIKPKS